jgi:predicted RND superfamily exporter protein
VLDKQYLTEKFVGLINADFTSIALMTSILVFVVLWLTYGRIELTLISFIPMFISFVWILGIMGLLGIEFNIINIIISALIFGLGDDYSLFIMDGLLQEYKTGKKNLSSYKSSIVLSAITTLAGLGVLLFAKHPALRSIAWLAIVGMICVVFIAQTLIPFLFALLIGNRTRKGFFPWTFLGLAKSVFSFTYFALGCVLLTMIGTLIIRLNPFNKEKGKIIYH